MSRRARRQLYPASLEKGLRSERALRGVLAEGTAVRAAIQDEHPRPIFHNGRAIADG